MRMKRGSERVGLLLKWAVFCVWVAKGDGTPGSVFFQQGATSYSYNIPERGQPLQQQQSASQDPNSNEENFGVGLAALGNGGNSPSDSALSESRPSETFADSNLPPFYTAGVRAQPNPLNDITNEQLPLCRNLRWPYVTSTNRTPCISDQQLRDKGIEPPALDGSPNSYGLSSSYGIYSRDGPTLLPRPLSPSRGILPTRPRFLVRPSIHNDFEAKFIEQGPSSLTPSPPGLGWNSKPTYGGMNNPAQAQYPASSYGQNSVLSTQTQYPASNFQSSYGNQQTSVSSNPWVSSSHVTPPPVNSYGRSNAYQQPTTRPPIGYQPQNNQQRNYYSQNTNNNGFQNYYKPAVNVFTAPTNPPSNTYQNTYNPSNIFQRPTITTTQRPFTFNSWLNSHSPSRSQNLNTPPSPLQNLRQNPTPANSSKVSNEKELEMYKRLVSVLIQRLNFQNPALNPIATPSSLNSVPNGPKILPRPISPVNNKNLFTSNVFARNNFGRDFNSRGLQNLGNPDGQNRDNFENLGKPGTSPSPFSAQTQTNDPYAIRIPLQNIREQEETSRQNQEIRPNPWKPTNVNNFPYLQNGFNTVPFSSSTTSNLQTAPAQVSPAIYGPPSPPQVTSNNNQFPFNQASQTFGSQSGSNFNYNPFQVSTSAGNLADAFGQPSASQFY